MAAKEDATKAEVQAQVTALQTALDGLRAVDKTNLNDLIAKAKAEAAKTDVYESNSLTVLNTAITLAENVVANPKATELEVAAAEKSLNQFFHTMAVGIFNLQYMLDPEKILVGGGITRQPSFLQRLQTELDRVMTAKPIAKVKPTVEVCTHLDQAQLIGAAYVWRKTYGKEDVHV